MSSSEWHGEPHVLIVHAVTPPEPGDQFDSGELDYDIEHPPSCPQETHGNAEHGYTDYTCDVAHDERECGLAYSLRYSGTPVTEPGTYWIQGWGRKIWTEAGDEYDGGVGVMDPEDPAATPARRAANLTAGGDGDGAVQILVGLTREELRAAVAELARMAIARCAEVFPRGMGDEAELAPNWPKCWADWLIEAVKADDEKLLAELADANPEGTPLAAACLTVLLAAAVGAETEAAS